MRKSKKNRQTQLSGNKKVGGKCKCPIKIFRNEMIDEFSKYIISDKLLFNHCTVKVKFLRISIEKFYTSI